MLVSFALDGLVLDWQDSVYSKLIFYSLKWFALIFPDKITQILDSVFSEEYASVVWQQMEGRFLVGCLAAILCFFACYTYLKKHLMKPFV